MDVSGYGSFRLTGPDFRMGLVQTAILADKGASCGVEFFAS